jgi:hypothetical protein
MFFDGRSLDSLADSRDIAEDLRLTLQQWRETWRRWVDYHGMLPDDEDITSFLDEIDGILAGQIKSAKEAEEFSPEARDDQEHTDRERQIIRDAQI